jgi:hypothetical protein
MLVLRVGRGVRGRGGHGVCVSEILNVGGGQGNLERESCSHDRLVLRRYAVESSIEEGKAEISERILCSSQSQPLRYRTHRTSPHHSASPSHNNTPFIPHPQPIASITHFPHPFAFTNFPHSLWSGHSTPPLTLVSVSSHASPSAHPCPPRGTVRLLVARTLLGQLDATVVVHVEDESTA